VHAGNYGGRVTFTKAGTAGQYVVWQGAGDGEALFAGIDVSASYVWLEGLTLRDQPYALMSKNAPTGVVVSRCSFFNNHYSIYRSEHDAVLRRSDGRGFWRSRSGVPFNRRLQPKCHR
jgi:hypothetical protein